MCYIHNALCMHYVCMYVCMYVSMYVSMYIAWPEFVSKGEEGLRVAVEVFLVKHALRSRHAELFAQTPIYAV